MNTPGALLWGYLLLIVLSCIIVLGIADAVLCNLFVCFIVVM